MMNRVYRALKLLSVLLIFGLVTVGVAMAQSTLPPTVEKSVSPTDINLAGSGGVDTTTVTIKVTGAGGTSTTITPMDVVFAIDSSGSMQTNDPSDLRLDAAASFVDKMDNSRDQAGLVSWDANIDFTAGLTNDFVYIKGQIANVDSSGGTNLNVGLNEAIAVMDAGAQTGAAHVIIFLTDGVGTYTPAGSGGPAATAAAKGYVIYSILLGNTGADGPLMDMANATGGAYYPAPTAGNLQAIFDTIFEEVVTSTIPYDVDVMEVTQDYIVDEASCSPACTVDTTNPQTVLTWEDIGLLSGDGDPDLSADEVVVLTFTAKSNMVGSNLPVQVLPNAVVTYNDSDGNPAGSVEIPQGYLNVNAPPDCSNAAPSWESLWPPNHKFRAIDILGVTDPEGNAVAINIDSIFQDEPVDTNGDGSFTPDGSGVGTSTAWVRSERTGTKSVPGDGRVYYIDFTATDESGAFCTGTVEVGVPHDVKDVPVGGGPLYDSTALFP